MKQTITLEVENTTVDDLIIARINEVCEEVDTSLDPGIMAAQMEILEGDGW